MADKKVICGQCKEVFKDNDKYLDHVCPVYGEKPTHPKSMGPKWQEITGAALERGAKRAELEAEGKTKEEAIAETRNIGKIAK